jgi:tripartite-type tricarboxylate transporter receptor subunit TctC
MTVLRVLLMLCVLPLVMPAAAQPNWPPRQIRIVVPFPPGGGTDVPARLIANELSGRLGQQVIVENKPGAGGNIGAEFVTKAPKDGTTLLMGTVNITSINPLLYANMPFDPVRDLAPITMTAIAPNVLVVSSESHIRTLNDLVREAKAKPGALNFASAGSGTTLHLAGELLKTMAGIDMVHVPYRGAPAALPDVMTGKVTTMFAAVPVVLALIKSDRLRPLAVSGTTRIPALQDVKTVEEQGFKGFDAVAWHGLFATGGTPAEIIARLHRETVAVLKMPEIGAHFAKQGLQLVSSTPEELARAVADDRAKWAEVVKRSGAKVD